MLTLQQIKETVQAYFKDKPVREVYLFGSYARGEASEGSDVDLLVKYDETARRLSLYDILGFKVNLEELFKSNVDLVERDNIYPRLKKYIEADKILIFSK